MGVLNVTPDSFSDGGRFFDLDTALAHAEEMASAGAAIIDVGGESTRPGAGEVPEQTEIDRAVPVIEAISRRIDVAISIDTSKAAVIREALGAGASMVNDVFALQRDGVMDVVAGSGCAICLMHMRGNPRQMQTNPVYDDVVAEVRDFLAERLAECAEAGIDSARIVLDPGFGFGKTDRHNVDLLAGLERLNTLERPLLAGLSRKQTLGSLTGRNVTERTAASLAAAVIAYQRGAGIIRTHDVAPTVDALKIAAAVRKSDRGG